MILRLKLGARYEYSSIIKKANIAPRISLAYKTGEGAQVSLAYGTFYEKPLKIHCCFILHNLVIQKQRIISPIIK